MSEVTVTAERLNLIGTATTASQGIVVNDELTLAPAYRPGQVLETVPGLAVTIHSGEGKANQYLLRGYNLDHGTDLAVFVDDMPVNEPTHAHGQGYADVNYMIPELATNVAYTKGPYYADVGDFGSVGSIHINYLDTIDPQVSATLGTMDFQRVYTMGSTPMGANGNLLGAFEVQHYNGPWTIPGEQHKFNGALRYSEGDASQGYSVTAMFYHDSWNAQTDQPERALTGGLISSRWDELDPSDAGWAQRASLSARHHQDVGSGRFTANAYLISNKLYLWNDFTHYLFDPIDGDQEQQHESRETLGADSAYAWTTPLLGVDTDVEVGVHTRWDWNDVSRSPTANRVALTAEQLAAVDYPSSQSESDVVHLGDVAAYFQFTSKWTDHFRSVLGFREDYQHGIDSGSYSGTAGQSLWEPHGSLIYRINDSTEVYASGGRGFHSDDLRGVLQARINGVAGAPLMASQTGEELGMRQELWDNKISITVAAYNLLADSETIYDPDVGQDSAGPGSKRTGYEVNLTYQVNRYFEIYGSYSGDRARYTKPYDDGTGHVGEYLPNAPFATGSINMYLRNLGPWTGGVEYRYLGNFPLTSGNCSDDAVKADFGDNTLTCATAPTAKGTVFGHGYGEWGADVHYALPAGWTLGLAGFNLLNKHGDSMEYYYVDRLPGEASYGKADLHFHPMEGIGARFTVTKSFGGS